MIQSLLLVIGLCLILYSLYKWSILNNDYFVKRGLKFMKPVPLLGNSGWFFGKGSLVDFIQNSYDAFPNEKIFGMFDFREPFYFIRDPKLIKEVGVKDFDHFQDRRTFIDKEDDELFGNMLVSMKGHEWREMRSALSPAFTGSKMRLMFDLVSHCGRQLSEYFCHEYETKGPQHHDMKDIFCRFTNDVIATSAFGIECDSLKNPNNEFFQIGKKFLDFQKPKAMFTFLMLRFMPKVAKALRIQFIQEETKNVFNDMIIDTMKTREREGIVRPDMINLLMQLKSGSLKKSEEANSKNTDGIAAVNEIEINDSKVKKTWTDIELIAQCFIFFLAGFDTSSTAMSFLAYELATNPEVQAKLSKEVLEVREQLQGNLLTYDALQKMKYMDMVVSETLRKWPPGPVIDRMCVKDYHYEDEEGLNFDIKSGRFVFFPVWALHHDARYFPNPEKFDPERFSDENKSDIDMDTYLPFGVGPRNCIGSRFALMEVKAVIYYLLERFNFEVGDKTQVPLKLKKGPAGLIPDKKIQLLLTPKPRHIYSR